MTQEQAERIAAMANQACEAIMAAGAESVVLIVTASTSDGYTGHVKYGAGNYYAQRGSAIEWIDKTRETGSNSNPEPPDEADWWKDT